MISPLSSSGTLSAQIRLNRNQNSLMEISQRLATGRKINSGKDNPAGLISSERLAAEIKSLEAESRAFQRSDANANIAEGHAAQLSSLFQDLSTLVVASANEAGMSDAEIAANQIQIDNTVASIQRFAGEAIASLEEIDVPNGGNADVEARYNSALAAAASVRSGGANDLSSGNFEAAQTALQGALDGIATARGQVGSYQRNVIQPQIRSNQIAIENLTESRGRIVDTDYAEEISNFVRAEILTKVGVRLLTISQQQARSVLSLLS